MRQYTEEYSYDEVGAFLEIVHAANSGNWTRTYSYNEPSLIENAHTSNRLSSVTVGGTTLNYDYDPHGNMISRPHLSAMNWDFKDQLKSVDLGGGGNAYYNYDSKGRRSRKVWEKSPGVTEERLYIGDFEIFRRRNGDGDVILERETLHVREISSDTHGTGKNMMDTEDSEPEEFRGFREKTGQEEPSDRNGKEKKNENDGSGKTAMFRYRIGAGSVADSALNISEQTASPHFAIIETRTVGDDGSPSQLISYQYDNHLGSATLELDDSATIISYEEYYPYGMSSYQAVTSQREVCKKRYRFTGKERDEESGLYYFGARYYDAEIGRWAAVDPGKQFFDSYRYTRNPISFFDPDGWADKFVAMYYNAIEKNGNNFSIDASKYAANFQAELAAKYPDDNVQVKAFEAGDLKGIAGFLNQGSAPDAKNVLMSHSNVGKTHISDVPYLKGDAGDHLITFDALENALDVDVGMAACGAGTTLEDNAGNLKSIPGTENSGSNVTQATRDYLEKK